MTEPTPITSVDRAAREPRSGARKRQDNPWDLEYGRDVWRLRALGIHNVNRAHLSFAEIPQQWLKELAKRWARWRLATGQVAEAAGLGTQAVTRFGEFLASPTVGVDSLDQVDRAVLERYLAHLHAKFSGRAVHRHMIGQLNLFFTAVRQHGWDTTLPTTAMFFPEDLPKDGQWLPRALSDHVMTQLERPDNLDQWNVPEYRLVTLILMRCGLRVTDALGLPTDCVVRDGDGAPYLRYYNHKMKREALVPIDEELERAIDEHGQQLRTRWPQGSPRLFPKPRDNPEGQVPIGSSAYRKALHRWLRRCDIRDEHGDRARITPHQWRHFVSA